MPNKMLIDASHQEETRVVVVRGNRIEEFDFESQDKKQLRGNIYLARVTRVEPSLQAAFVEYGGNRHGFLAFSEIHPDYYQIPVADRQALLRAEAEEAEDEDDEAEEGRSEHGRGRRRRRGGRSRDRGEDQQASGDAGNGGPESQSVSDGDAVGDEGHELSVTAEDPHSNADVNLPTAPAESIQESVPEGEETGSSTDDGEERSASMAAATEADVVSEPVPVDRSGEGGVEQVPAAAEDEEVVSVGAEDALEEVRSRRKPPRRHYKIQEVIKRRQILLVQVVKEERGNKGAALTTYLSLAGRYSVLMPNTARGGGISRKITSAQDRKRLKEIMQELDVPQGMGVILRTAGENRTKAEIKRDYEYLMRLWENVRTLTLQSTAPALVYEEGSLIKRSVRDLYNKDIDEILVAGEAGYREAKDFMRMLMPSHAKMVQPYRDTVPILARNGIEAQLDKMLQPQVTLKSGGYIIINQTEALVAIDVNSGRSTREHSIEDTALQTNLEAAEEIARQLRLRDLAGLIVIDFIDMEESRNNRAVEKKLKECLKNDRARIQVGRISHFGLLEMSRQRIRASVLESTMKPCPHCGGTGHVRSDSSVALMVVRAVEEFLLKDSRSNITVKTPTATAMYLLNHKRNTLTELERRFGVAITVEADETVGSQHYNIVRGALADKPALLEEQPAPVDYDDAADEDVEPDSDEGDEAAEAETSTARDQDEPGRKRRKRRRRRGGRDRDREQDAEGQPQHATGEAEEPDNGDDEDEPVAAAEGSNAPEQAEDGERRKRRRGKRGGRRNRPEGGEQDGDAVEAVAEGSATEPQSWASGDTAGEALSPAAPERDAEEEAPSADAYATSAGDGEPTAEDGGPTAEEEAATPLVDDATLESIAVAPPQQDEPVVATESSRRTSRRAPSAAERPAEPIVSSVVSDTSAPAAEEKPKRGGWWQRKSFF